MDELEWWGRNREAQDSLGNWIVIAKLTVDGPYLEIKHWECNHS